MKAADWVFDDKRYPHLRAGLATFTTGFGVYWFSHWPGVGVAAMITGSVLIALGAVR